MYANHHRITCDAISLSHSTEYIENQTHRAIGIWGLVHGYVVVNFTIKSHSLPAPINATVVDYTDVYLYIHLRFSMKWHCTLAL